MITIGMNYDIFPDKEQLFVTKFKDVMDILSKDEFHQSSHLYKDVYNESPSFLVVSVWETRDAFLKFIKSDIFKKVTDWGKDGILSARPRHKVYSIQELQGPAE
ncbi:MAG: antibiotic biosynthesis monooxygenase [Candidatus Heimdallarchaeota archaeon]|nr:antibiotic biosynthesis monooxygenase [Candidatus Heimdallarchaeota archaeon]